MSPTNFLDSPPFSRFFKNRDFFKPKMAFLGHFGPKIAIFSKLAGSSEKRDIPLNSPLNLGFFMCRTIFDDSPPVSRFFENRDFFAPGGGDPEKNTSPKGPKTKKSRFARATFAKLFLQVLHRSWGSRTQRCRSQGPTPHQFMDETGGGGLDPCLGPLTLKRVVSLRQKLP